jgi:hypothetical protein
MCYLVDRLADGCNMPNGLSALAVALAVAFLILRVVRP